MVAYGFLPSKSATLGKTAAGHCASCARPSGAQPTPGLTVCKTSPAGGRSYLLPEQPTPEQLQQVLAGDAGIHPTLEVLEGETDHWLHVLHRVKAGRDVFFIANQNHQGEPRSFRFRITADGTPECWDAMRNEITAVPFSRKGRQVELSLTLEPNESVLLVFQPKPRALPPRREPGSAAGPRTIAVTRDPAPAPPEPVLSLDQTASAGAERLLLDLVSGNGLAATCPARHALFPEADRHSRRGSRQESHFRRHGGQQLHALHQRQGGRPAVTAAPKAGAIRWNWT